MRIQPVWSRRAACLAGGLIAASFVPDARAFPLIDPTNMDSIPSDAPSGVDLPDTDVQGLRNQIALTRGGGPAHDVTGWTFIPRLSMQEEFTDNALAAESPRRFDAVTLVAPGIAVNADTYRIQLHLDYQPILSMYAAEGPLNSLTQQLSALATITVVPDLAYVAVRAVSGVQSALGGLLGTGIATSGGSGGIGGGTGSDANSASATSLVQALNGQGGEPLNRLNEVQTSSFGISPYLLHKFGDIGTAKVGVSLNETTSETISGFASSPFPTIGGANSQHLQSTEELARFSTGERFGKFQDIVSADLWQSTTNTNASQGVLGSTALTSERETFDNQVSYALTREVTLLASIGEQRINYSQAATTGLPRIDGLTWSAGVTIIPSPNSFFTIRYGHQNGFTTVTGDARLALSGRTVLTLDYSNSVGTQLENTEAQLNAAGVATQQAINLVSAQTGGPALVIQNGLPVEDGIFRFSTLSTSLVTSWPRDTWRTMAVWTVQTNLTPTYAINGFEVNFQTGQETLLYSPTPTGAAGQTTDYKTVSTMWTHQLHPDLTLSGSAAYSLVRRPEGLGTDGSLALSSVLQYALSPGTSVMARYSFFDRVSKIPGYSLYENMLLLGFTKRF